MRELSVWVEEYTDTMFAYARGKVPSEEIAEDLVQDTFLAAIESKAGFQGNSSVKTWLFSILKRKIADFHRKAFRSPGFVSIENSRVLESFFDEDGAWRPGAEPKEWREEAEHNPFDNSEFNLVFRDCLGRLPDQWNMAVQFRYIQDMPGEKVCKELSLSQSNYWQILHRAKLQLRACLEAHWFAVNR